tara:strand:- start:45 stop:290 length:246 start_codon:yes stop_codon:yes gene_type:complete
MFIAGVLIATGLLLGAGDEHPDARGAIYRSFPAGGDVLEEDAIRHTVTWEEGSMAGLKRKLVRLEFEFVEADLFAFVAAGE